MTATVADMTPGALIVSSEPITQVQLEPQVIFDKLCEQRSSLAGFSKMRREMLAENKRYGKLSEEIGSLRLQKKQIELDFDTEHESIKENIQHTKDRILSHETILRDIALIQWRDTGTPLELVKKTRNGGLKKVRIQFVPRFLQLSLFPA